MDFLNVVSVGTLIQIGTTVVGMVWLFSRLSTHLEYVREDVNKLADIPLTIARHDERLKNLERKN